MSRMGIFKIAGVEYDMDDLTLDEIEAFEELCGADFSTVNFGSGKVMKAIATILMRRTNPAITPEEIGRIKLIDFGQPDEEVPDIGPPDAGAAASENDSEPAAAGPLRSIASIPA